jgi:uncharacterized membrane protein
MKKLIDHLRRSFFRGVLASIPIVLTLLVIRIIYLFVDKRFTELIARFLGHRIPGLGVLLVLLLFYITGLVVGNVVGKRMFSMLESVMHRIPIIRTTYQVGKQLSNTLSLPEKQIFKKAVLLEFFQRDAWVVGFVTGTFKSPVESRDKLKVFVPTVPNPTTGFLVMVEESRTIDPGWTVEEAMKMVISGGIIGPPEAEGAPRD